jgi:hypothetical protein
MLYATTVVNGEDVGHLWICDGYLYYPEGGYTYPPNQIIPVPPVDLPGHYYHHNWGWHGSKDGWYIEGNFSPSYNFSASSIYIYYDIHPK